MSGLFEHIEMFDEGDKVATRQAIAVANKRFNDTFAGFLRQASSEKEFNGRLALVEQDIANMAADVANEYGGDAEKIAKAVSSTVKAAFGPTPPADEAPMCENCGGHGCKDCTGDPEAARTASENDAIWDEATTKFVRMHPEEVAPGTPAEQIPSEAYETAKYHIDQDKDTILASVTSYDVDSVMNAIEQWFNQHFRTASKDRPEHLKAQDEVQLADEHSQVSPWLKKQIQDEDQEDGGNLRNKEAAAHTVEKKGDEFFVTEKGEGEVAGPFDSQEKAYARANELNDLENLETEETHKEAKGKCECWDGYKRVPGTKPCAPGSCEKCDSHSKKSATSKDEWVNEGDTVTDHGEKKKVEEIKQEGDHKVVELDDDSIEDIDDVQVTASVKISDVNPDQAKAMMGLMTGNGDTSIGDMMGGGLGGGLIDSVGSGVDAVNQAGKAVGDLASLNVGDAVGDAAKGIGDVADAVTNPIGGALDSVFGSNQTIGQLFDNQNKLSFGLGDIAKGIGDTAGGIANTVSDAASLPGKAMNAVGDAAQKNIVDPIQQNVVNPVNNAVNAVGSGIDQASNAVQQVGSEAASLPGQAMNAIGDEASYLQNQTQQGYENARNSAVTPAMHRAMQLKQATKPETGDKTEERESLPTGNEDAYDGPSPKIDKTKWKPNATNPDGNLKPIETEGDNSPHPTRHMDIKDKPDYQQDTLENLKKYDNKVWDREQLPTAKGDEAGFEGTRNIDQPTKAAETFPNKNQANPVTNISLPQALADKTSAWYDENSLFRSWLSDHGIALTDDPEDLKGSPAVRALWKQFVQDVPSPEKGEDVIGGPSEAPESIDEPVVEDIIDEEPMEEDVTIEETPEDIEEIIEREDDEDDRVKVIHDHDEEDDFEFEDSSDDEIEALIREMEENPDDWQ